MLCINPLLNFLVFFNELFGFKDHPLDLILSQTTSIVGNCDDFLFASSFFNGTHIQCAVCIDFEGNFNLGYATSSWRNASQIELTEFVVFCHYGAFTFKYCDRDCSLLVLVGSEYLRLLRRDYRVTWD